ncbi:MAG: 50S ribosomal protein L10 [Firmicutes bacterium]|nr:50S ribosomal protein L10 [Bacillota bacterium]
MPTPKKAAIIDQTREELEQSQVVVLANYRGLTVHQLDALRKNLAESGVNLRVIKNTLIERAAESLGIDGLKPYLEGPTIVAFGKDDPVQAAKLMSKAARELRKIEIKAGLLGKDALDAAAIKSLADLPSREVLLSKLVGTLNAPIYQLAWVLQAPITGLARALDQVRQQREAQA